MFGIFIKPNKRNMMALYLAKLAYSKSTYRCLYSLRRTFSSNSANDTTPFIVETTLPFIGYRCEPPSRSVETSPKELMSFYKDMSIMRRMEITADSLYKSRLVRGFCHLYDGQEAIAVGIKEVTSQTDCVITAYRDHCIFLARGGSLLEVFAELLGRKDGSSLGRGGSMHLYKRDNRFYGGHGIVGAHIPLGCGLAFALKYEKVDGVSITLYGDGAANQGQLYEALNMAALWNLPVVFVCENNHYGMGTAEWRAAKCSAYYKRGHYVPGLKVDGMDALAVKQAVKFGKDHALKNGPIILEMDTYRYHGHSMSDPGSTYRTRDEITTFRQERDPIERVRKLLLQKELASPDDLKNIDKEAKQMVNDAVAQAKSWILFVDMFIFLFPSPWDVWITFRKDIASGICDSFLSQSSRTTWTYLLVGNLVDLSCSLQSLISLPPLILGVWSTFPWEHTSFYDFSGGFYLAEADLAVLHVTSCSSALVFILGRRKSS